MICETIQFTEKKRVKLKTYLNDWTPRPCVFPKRGAVVVLPGGGYQMLTSSEGEPVAMAFATAGYHAFVLQYRLNKEAVFPNPMVDAGRALRYIRSRAEEWYIDPDKIILCGFSAGGHVAAVLSTTWNQPNMMEACDAFHGENKPNALILGYASVTIDREGNNRMYKLLRGNLTIDEMVAKGSAEKWVGRHTPPTFLWNTYYDQMVPVEHSLLFAQALAKHDVPFELHTFTDGGHGGVLFTPATAVGDPSRVSERNAAWFPMCLRWLASMFGNPELPGPQAKLEGEYPRAHLGHAIPMLF